MKYEITPKDKKFIEQLFDYHNGVDIDPVRFAELRAAAKKMAEAVIAYGGNDRQKDLMQSIECIRLSLHYAIASIVIPPDKT